MRYPIVVDRGDETHAHGVVIPDLPGCFSAGDTLEEAFENAKEAAEGWIECELEDGRAIPGTVLDGGGCGFGGIQGLDGRID